MKQSIVLISLHFSVLSILSELLLCLLIHSLASISFIKKTAKGQTEGENAKINYFFLFFRT